MNKNSVNIIILFRCEQSFADKCLAQIIGQSFVLDNFD